MHMYVYYFCLASVRLSQIQFLSNPEQMETRIRLFQIISIFVYVVNQGTFTQAGYAGGEMNLYQNLPNNTCVSRNRSSCFSFRCNFGESDNATQIKKILNLIGNSNLTKLYTKHTIIRDIPKTICRLKQLKHLNISRNKLTTLEPTNCFAGMHYLENLDLQDNTISYIPDGIFANLSQLRDLILDNNNISDLLGICTNLPLLQRLNNNQISTIPQGCFQHFKQLEFLDISCNLISSFSTELIAPLILMKYINVSNNVLKSILYDRTTTINIVFSTDPKFSSMRYIRWMDFSRNQLSTLDSWILLLAQICNGCVVDFSYNNITTFTSSGRGSFMGRKFRNKKYPYSITIDLKGNIITHITDMVERWKFENNTDHLLGFVKQKYTRPFKIILDSLTCDCRDFGVKKYMTEHENYNLDLTQAICSAPTNLRNKSLSSIPINDMVCNIESECPSKCKLNNRRQIPWKSIAPMSDWRIYRPLSRRWTVLTDSNII